MNFTDIHSTEVQTLIQQYLNKELKGEGLTLFEKELQTNEALVKEVAFSKEMVFVLQNKPLLDLKSQLDGIAKETPIKPDFSDLDQFPKPPDSGTNFFSGWKIWVLGGIIIAGLAGIYFGTVGLPAKQFTEEQRNLLLDTYLKPYENVIVLDENYPSPMIEGMNAYDKGDYSQAIKNLGLFSDDDNIKLYLGISKILNDDAAGAIPILKDLSKSELPNYQIPSKWYLAMAYIEVNKISESIILLDELQYDATYGERAKALLIQLG